MDRESDGSGGGAGSGRGSEIGAPVLRYEWKTFTQRIGGGGVQTGRRHLYEYGPVPTTEQRNPLYDTDTVLPALSVMGDQFAKAWDSVSVRNVGPAGADERRPSYGDEVPGKRIVYPSEEGSGPVTEKDVGFTPQDLYTAEKLLGKFSGTITANCGLKTVGSDDDGWVRPVAVPGVASMSSGVLRALPYAFGGGTGYVIVSTSPRTPPAVLSQLDTDGWDRLKDFWNPMHPERNKADKTQWCTLWGIIPKAAPFKSVAPTTSPSLEYYFYR